MSTTYKYKDLQGRLKLIGRESDIHTLKRNYGTTNVQIVNNRYPWVIIGELHEYLILLNVTL